MASTWEVAREYNGWTIHVTGHPTVETALEQVLAGHIDMGHWTPPTGRERWWQRNKLMRDFERLDEDARQRLREAWLKRRKADG